MNGAQSRLFTFFGYRLSPKMCPKKMCKVEIIAKINVSRTGTVYERLRVHIFFALFYAHLG